MAAFKDFDVLIAEEAAKADEAPRFKLRGIEFVCVTKPSVPGLLKLSVAEGNLVESVNYIASMVRFNQRQKFLDILHEESDEEISADVLSAISEYLTESYGGRPTPA